MSEGRRHRAIALAQGGGQVGCLVAHDDNDDDDDDDNNIYV